MILKSDDGNLVNNSDVWVITFTDEPESSTATLLGANGEILGTLRARDKLQVMERVMLFMETEGEA